MTTLLRTTALPHADPPACTHAVPQYANWQAALADAVTDATELCRLLDLPSSLGEGAKAAGGFPLLVPRTFLSRIRPGDPNDPLLLQVLPLSAEKISPPHFRKDPVGDAEATCRPGLLGKYDGRLLMVTTGACAVHCRFCFRRHFPYNLVHSGVKSWEGALAKIGEAFAVHEVILSGGDPLTIEDEELRQLIIQISQIPHIQRLRIHTRLPIVLPQRVTDSLLAGLRQTRLTPIAVIHTNHPAEIDGAVVDALDRFVDAGIPVLSQTVLLRGVNDHVETLAALFERLVNVRVMPYYLHQMDQVTGAAHFEVPEATGVRLIEELRGRLPGYAVPRYVRETPRGLSKEVLA
ncbi:MAG: EF-P beta-lysylation protein EpmB [Thermoguttaceae bacterium]